MEGDEDDLARLTEAACAGDRAAVDALVLRYLPQLRAFVRLRAGAAVRVHESNSDLVQSVCREVLQHADRFRHPGDGAFRHWLFTSALRKIRQRQRYLLAQKRDVRAVAQGADAAADPLLVAQYSSFSSPSGVAQRREELERVEAAFDALSEEQREVVTLAHLVGLSRAEIAERLGKSEGAVRVTLHRALARIAALLEEPC
jgi:RNA polymerase sigma-70 factor (ECF subfamily)